MKVYGSLCESWHFIYFQLFKDYHVFKRAELETRAEKTPLASEIEMKLDAESKVRLKHYMYMYQWIVECLNEQM